MKANSPALVTHPEIPFDQVAISFIVTTQAVRNKRVISLNLTTKNGRILPSGHYEEMPEMTFSSNYTDVVEDTKSDPDLAAAFIKIKDATEAFLIAKGV